MTMTTRRVVLLGALALGGFVLGAASSCQRDLNGAHCPCVTGWTCCTDNTCRPAGMSCEGGPILIDGGACIPPGNGVKLTSISEFEALIGGDWLRCSGTAYPADYGIGLRISHDRTWNALEDDGAGGLAPVTTGFDGYGTWWDEDENNGRFQFNLMNPAQDGGDAFFITVVDSGHMQMDAASGGGPNVYRRPDVSCPCPRPSADAGTDADDAGPSLADGGDSG